jgi:hypothetical protein
VLPGDAFTGAHGTQHDVPIVAATATALPDQLSRSCRITCFAVLIDTA